MLSQTGLDSRCSPRIYQGRGNLARGKFLVSPASVTLTLPTHSLEQSFLERSTMDMGESETLPPSSGTEHSPLSRGKRFAIGLTVLENLPGLGRVNIAGWLWHTYSPL
jgi:hypothetical protein